MSEVRCTELAFQLYGAQERIAELKALATDARTLIERQRTELDKREAQLAEARELLYAEELLEPSIAWDQRRYRLFGG